MTITTDMLLAAGCTLDKRCWVAIDVNGIPCYARYGFMGLKWGRLNSDVKPRFRVKAKSVQGDGHGWVTGDRYIYSARVPIPDDFKVCGTSS